MSLNFETQEEREGAIKRAESLRPRVEGVYVTSAGYVIDRAKGHPEVLVSFRGLDELLAAAPVEVVAEVEVPTEPTPEPVVEDVANDDSEDVGVDVPVAETPEEKKARRAAARLAKAAQQ